MHLFGQPITARLCFFDVDREIRTGPGARLYADIRSVIETARRRAITALDTDIRR